MSLRSATALQKTLSIHYQKVDIVTVNCLDDLRKVVISKPDLAFIGLRGIPMNSGDTLRSSNTIFVTTYLTERGIICTGSPSKAHTLENDKALAKQKVLDSGLATSKYFVTNSLCSLKAEAITMSYPMFVKPLSMGGGSGIDEESVVHTYVQLEAKVKSIKLLDNSESIVEDYLTGREFSMAILKDSDTNDYFLMPLELIAPADKHGDRILSQSVKEHDTETHKLITNRLLKAKVSRLAHDVFIALGARDYGRIDIRLDVNGEPQFLEANLIPSIIDGFGNFPKACLINEGISHKEAMLRIIDLAMRRDNYMQPSEPAVPAISI